MAATRKLTAAQVRAKVHRFVDKWNGRFEIDDGVLGPNAYGAQCVNLANQFASYLRIEPFPGNAGTFMFDSHPDCTWIPNQPENRPHPGDIVIWGISGELPFGHVAVCVWSTVNTLVSFDQNWPTGSPCHKQGHNYDGIAGWLHAHKLDVRDSWEPHPRHATV